MRAFWTLVSINLLLAALYLASALWVVLNPASGCTVDGLPCIEVGFGWLALSIGGPTAALVAIVVAGLRVRRHRPRAAMITAAIPLLLILSWVVVKNFGVLNF